MATLTALLRGCMESFKSVLISQDFGAEYELLCTELSLQSLRIRLLGESVSGIPPFTLNILSRSLDFHYWPTRCRVYPHRRPQRYCILLGWNRSTSTEIRSQAKSCSWISAEGRQQTFGAAQHWYHGVRVLATTSVWQPETEIIPRARKMGGLWCKDICWEGSAIEGPHRRRGGYLRSNRNHSITFIATDYDISSQPSTTSSLFYSTGPSVSRAKWCGAAPGTSTAGSLDWWPLHIPTLCETKNVLGPELWWRYSKARQRTN